MASPLALSLAALVSLLPASLISWRRDAMRPDLMFWAVVAAAVAGPTAYSLVHLGGAWKVGLSSALWVSIAASMAVFALLSAVAREVWRLLPLLLPYLFALGVCATLWSDIPERGPPTTVPDAWFTAHIAFSVATYGLCTLAAVAGAAVLLQERALKRRRPTGLTRRLPSVSDASRLQVRLLGASGAVLALGIATGMANQYLAQATLFAFDHKTLLSLLAFVVIAGLLLLHQRTGLRGQRAARVILVAYLLLTLAYPGVKFVTDVLIG